MHLLKSSIGCFAAKGYNPSLLRWNPEGKEYSFSISDDRGLWIKEAGREVWELLDKTQIKACPGPLDSLLKLHRFKIQSGPYANEYVFDESSIMNNDLFPDGKAYMDWFNASSL